MHYYGTRLSENISRREPEGYLLCLNVPVARIGTQEYLPEELGFAAEPGSPAAAGSGLVTVYRPEEEVFSPRTMASFEGMPVTNDHPPEGVDISNIRALQKGHAHNVRRGSGAESDLLLADLIITDPVLITAILEEGKREISCGYTYELCEENGRYIQRKIRGNHVAVVDAGRAGSRVSIKDHCPVYERRENSMKKSLSKILARMAKDGDPEIVAEIIGEMIEQEADPEDIVPDPETETEEPAAVVETPGGSTVAVDGESDGLNGILERLDRIIALLQPPAADEETVPEILGQAIGEALEEAIPETVDPMAEEVAAVMEEILAPEDVDGYGTENTVLSEDEEEEEDPDRQAVSTGDALRAALAVVRPVLARMPRKTRNRMAGDIAARLRRSSCRTADADVYAALASARRRTSPASADLGKRIMENRNVNYRKGAGRRG